MVDVDFYFLLLLDVVRLLFDWVFDKCVALVSITLLIKYGKSDHQTGTSDDSLNVLILAEAVRAIRHLSSSHANNNGRIWTNIHWFMDDYPFAIAHNYYGSFDRTHITVVVVDWFMRFGVNLERKCPASQHSWGDYYYILVVTFNYITYTFAKYSFECVQACQLVPPECRHSISVYFLTINYNERSSIPAR